MVVLQIDGGGFQTAATAFAEGNQLTALCFDRLTSVLAGCGGMAGDDSTSFSFVASYDDAAGEAVGAVADLAEAFTRVGHLTHASLTNHATANARAVIGGAVVYDGDRLPDIAPDTGYLSVLPCAPPSALGAATPGLSTKIAWILDHIEGFVWPGADLDRLREAAAGWRAAASSLEEVAGCCDSAIRGFWLERSPEIALALDATTELKAQVTELATCCASLAGACESYADAVEAKHREILDLAHWVLEQIVEGVLISVALGVLTGGAGTAAGLGAVAAKVAAQSPKFTALLDTLRALAEGCAATTRATHDTLAATRLRLVKYKNAAVARSNALGERGEIRLIASGGELERSRQLARLRETFEDPKRLDPQDLRGLSKDDLHEVLSKWESRPSSRGEGLVFRDPVHDGRQIRLMEGYPGNRPDPTTHGFYAVVSQNGQRTKVPLEGNPAL